MCTIDIDREVQTLEKTRSSRNNFSTFSMGDPNSRCVLSRTDSNNELRPRYLANRPKLNLQPPPSTSITNQQRDSTDEVASYNFKAMNFPMLGNVENYNSSIMAKNFGSEQHITASEKQRPSNEIKRSQVNRSLTQISNYGNVRNVWKSQVSVCFVRFLTRLLKCLYVCPSVILTIININLEKIFLVFLMSKLFVFIKVIFWFSGRG